MSKFFNKSSIASNIKQISLKIGMNLPLCPAIYLAILCDTLEDVGGDVEEFLAALGHTRSELLKPNGTVKPRILNKAINLAITMTSRTDLGIEYGKKIDLLSSGLVSQAILTAPNVAEAAVRGMNYSRLNGVYIRAWQESSEDGKAILYFEVPWLESAPEKTKVFYYELLLVQCQKYLQNFAGEEHYMVDLALACPKPNHADKAAEYFGSKIKYGAKVNSASLKAEIAYDMPINVSGSFSQLVLEQCEEALNNLKSYDSWTQKVNDLLNYYDNSHIPDVRTVAKKLAVSPRTLTRQLEGEGITFKSIVNNKRLDQATKLLKKTNMSVEAIAAEVGFSNASNFRKAFKKWTGKTPTEFRPK